MFLEPYSPKKIEFTHSSPFVARSLSFIPNKDNYTLVANFSPRANYVRSLAISSSVGGTVTSPGEGAFGYAAPTTVSIVATAEPDYEFSGWTGTAVSVGKVADANAASTIPNFVERPYMDSSSFASSCHG